MSLRDLPKIYRQFLPLPLRPGAERTSSHHLSETKATCFSCAMAPKAGKVPPADTTKWYQASLRCCTYQPFLPNFLVGQALAEGPDSLAAEIRQQIKNRQYCLPIGIVPSPKFQVSFNHREPGEFGHVADWLCPYLDSSDLSCRVWAIRGSVCSTYFCKSSYGKQGLRFWQGLGEYLAVLEMCLLEEALALHGFSPREQNASLEFLNMQTCTPELWRAEAMPAALEKELWRDWANEKEKFYELCFHWIRDLKRPDFLRLLPPGVKELEADLLVQYNEIQVSAQPMKG